MHTLPAPSNPLCLPSPPIIKMPGEPASDGGVCFAQPEQWIGRAIELAGDELTMPQAAERFGRVIGQPVQYVQVSMAEVRRTLGEDQAAMYTWFNQVGYGADLPALRALYPALTTLEQWLRRTGWQGAAAGAATRHA